MGCLYHYLFLKNRIQIEVDEFEPMISDSVGTLHLDKALHTVYDILNWIYRKY